LKYFFILVTLLFSPTLLSYGQRHASRTNVLTYSYQYDTVGFRHLMDTMGLSREFVTSDKQKINLKVKSIRVGDTNKTIFESQVGKLLELSFFKDSLKIDGVSEPIFLFFGTVFPLSVAGAVVHTCPVLNHFIRIDSCGAEYVKDTLMRYHKKLYLVKKLHHYFKAKDSRDPEAIVCDYFIYVCPDYPYFFRAEIIDPVGRSVKPSIYQLVDK
jgi:hypothetical protein